MIEKTPAIVLCDPKYPHNVGAAVRAASCFGAHVVVYTGHRVSSEIGKRLPREERMKDYKDVELVNWQRPFDRMRTSLIPVAVEFRDKAESLIDFVHPKHPVYVFGPEDGSISQSILGLCHRFVMIPSVHCLNLAAAVNVVLYDRMVKMEKK